MAGIPNALTLLRCVAVVALVVLLAPGVDARWAALGVFVAAAFTDFLDGWLARRLQAVSAFGRMLDSIADKLLVAVTLLMLTADATIPGVHALAAALILMREITISGLREHLAPKGVSIPATWAGKWKTALQMLALATLIAAPLTPVPFAQLAGLILLWAAAVLTIVSGAQYAWSARGSFRPTAT